MPPTRCTANWQDGLPSTSLFMDVQEGILAGADFADVIRQQVARCDVLVALIGPKWNEVDAQGHQQLDDPADFVRIEIASALADGKHVIPVLLDGAPLPTERVYPRICGRLSNALL